MSGTLDLLDGEGATKVVTIRKTQTRRECDVCGDPAHYKHTFLLVNGRNNPTSNAYGKDDCTWCNDSCSFVCEDHKRERTPPDGMEWCATLTASKRFAHMFLYWREEIIKAQDMMEVA